MKKLIGIVVVVLLGMTQIDAQQIHQLTHYMTNQFVFNPAVAGTSTDLDAKVGYRRQWTGIEDGPSTFYLSAHTNASVDKEVGLGLIFYGDVTGPTRRQGVQLAYSYHLPVSDVGYLALGLSANLFQYRINYDELIVNHLSDPTLTQGDQSDTSFDASFGAYFYTDDLWVSLSSIQLLQSKLAFVNSDETIKLDRHYYAGAGYNFDVSDDISIEPSFFLKSVKAIPLSAELSARVIYDDSYWVGASYRTQDAFALMLGLDLNKGFNLVYSYDMSTSELNEYGNGSHELTIGYHWRYREEDRLY